MVIPLVNTETLTELRVEILAHSPTPKPTQARRFVEQTMRRYEPWCEVLPVTALPDIPKCRDTKDRKFVDLAVHGKAQLLIARDPDLLVMKADLAALHPPIRVAEDRYDLTYLMSALPTPSGTAPGSL